MVTVSPSEYKYPALWLLKPLIFHLFQMENWWPLGVLIVSTSGIPSLTKRDNTSLHFALLGDNSRKNFKCNSSSGHTQKQRKWPNFHINKRQNMDSEMWKTLLKKVCEFKRTQRNVIYHSTLLQIFYRLVDLPVLRMDIPTRNWHRYSCLDKISCMFSWPSTEKPCKYKKCNNLITLSIIYRKWEHHYVFPLFLQRDHFL